MNLAIQENAGAIQTIVTEQGTQNTSITSLQEAIAAINDTENGILASANAYTDAEIIEVGNSISGIEGDIADLQSQIDDIVDEDGGILASAQAAIESAISELTSTLGTAAYAAVEDFDAAGAADEALEAAKTYTNTALTWGEIPASEAVE